MRDPARAAEARGRPGIGRDSLRRGGGDVGEPRYSFAVKQCTAGAAEVAACRRRPLWNPALAAGVPQRSACSHFPRCGSEPAHSHAMHCVIVAARGGDLACTCSATPPGPIEDIPEDGWRASIDGNLTATFLTIKSFLPGMKDRGRGNIITVSSAAGRRPHPRSPIPYAAAKAGVSS